VRCALTCSWTSAWTGGTGRTNCGERTWREERADDLAGQRQTLDEQKHRKDQICRELIAGRLTLAAAMRQFMELPGMTEAMWRELRTSFPGATAEESMSRRVILWACDLLEQEPARANALRQRLLAELEGR
jgi:hypothetical protein